MKFNLTESEAKNILEMHSKVRTANKIIKEDDVKPSIKDQLQSFIDSGCIKNGYVVSMGSTNPNKQFAVKQESTLTPGKFRYFFVDNTYGSVGPDGKFKMGSGTWECNTGKIETDKVTDAKAKADAEEVKKATDANIELTKKEGGWKTYDELISIDTKENINNSTMYEKKVVDGISLYRRKVSGSVGEALTDDQKQIIAKWQAQGAKLRKDLDPEQAKTWTSKVVSPKSEGYFVQDLVMYFPPTTITNTEITSAFQDAVRDQTPESSADCKTTIEAYYMAFKKKKKLEPNMLNAMKEKVQACKNEFYGSWGAFSGGKQIDGYIDMLTGKAPGGPSSYGDDSIWRIK